MQKGCVEDDGMPHLSRAARQIASPPQGLHLDGHSDAGTWRCTMADSAMHGTILVLVR